MRAGGTTIDDGRLDALRALDVLDSAPEAAFDDIVQLASFCCAAPTALVSLVDADRQWFKARVGFADCETDLDRSVCRFVVAERELVVIPDLAADPRTAANPLVTHEPRIRFYAGAPLTTAAGHVLGALCVIDVEPRPDGLSPAQAATLRALARRVVEALELRNAARDLAAALVAREEADTRRTLAERRQWEHLFQNLKEGFILGAVIRDLAGRVVDWRYEQVNAAWSDLVGVAAEDAIGRTIRQLFPGIEDAWVEEFSAVVDSGEPVRFTRQVGALGRWYDGVVQPAGPERFTVLFIDVTDRIEATVRQEALLELGDALRDCATTAQMTTSAAEIAGRALGASRAAYGTVDAELETVDVEPDWTADGVSSIAGAYRFADYGDIRRELAAGRPLVIEDVATDPRTARDPGPMLALSIGALVNMPVRERGRVVAVFIVHSSRARAWSAAELAFIRNVADRLEVGIARLRAETQQELVNAEIAHRLKNSLAMVQAIANQTLRTKTDAESLEAFGKRLLALGTAHDALLGRGLQSADLRDLIAQVLAAAGIGDRYTAEGPQLALGARATLSTSMLLHELATNASKYGSLSADGTVAIGWRADGEEVVLDWTERGGPPATPPTRKGFGSRLLAIGMLGIGGSTLRYDPDGFSATFRGPKALLEHS